MVVVCMGCNMLHYKDDLFIKKAIKHAKQKIRKPQ